VSVQWKTGPGTIISDAGQCTWPSTYAFVDAFAALRAAVLGDIANGLADLNNLERFDVRGRVGGGGMAS
jgi:hypothetical protein